MGDVVGSAPPANAFQQFDMAHFMGNYVGVHALGVQNNIGTSPRRADAAPGTFRTAAIFLVLLRRLADDDFRVGFFALIKRVYARLSKRNGVFEGFVFVCLDIRAEIDLSIR